ncbi:CBS domain-containing protein [Sporolactobacillus kofuensis]|uniref:CBS domain-containing protein n=1 Tax=Sporolactobacillus kofuensis TaxID=269672 RepID=A0ABW1WA83_9BACL|nr:CBS domain-containing protein [Sporolactobacillus kofuensis]MCO7174756.1 CBS domain-containing protein [Sporolactobacillus kofuensis]
MLVEQLMIKNVVTVRETDTIKSLIKTMIDHNIGGAPVLDGNDRLVGYISDGDLLRALSPKQQTIYDLYSLISAIRVDLSTEKIRDLLDQQVKDLMKKKNLQMVHEDKDLDSVLKLLSHYHIKRIPVVDDERHVVGLLTRSHIIRHIGEQLINE